MGQRRAVSAEAEISRAEPVGPAPMPAPLTTALAWMRAARIPTNHHPKGTP